MAEWINSTEELESLIEDGYDVKIAGIRDTVGWWAIKNIPYKRNKSFRIQDSVIEEMKELGYREKGTICDNYRLVKGERGL